MNFKVRGHANTLCAHRNTIEFTKDTFLSKRGDCILGVEATFDPVLIKKLSGNILVRITAKSITDTIRCTFNPEFSDSHEIVIRRTGFSSKRTLGLFSDKAACDIDRRIVEHLKSPENFAEIVIEDEKTPLE